MTDKLSVIRLIASVLVADPEGSLLEQLCNRAMATLGVDAVAVTVMSTPDHRHVAHATDREVMLVEDVQFTSGDGPVVEAYRDDTAVLVPDLPAEAQARWPLFGEASSRDPRYAGVFAFPMSTGRGGPIGVVTMYTRHGRRLDPEAVADAQVLTHAMTLAVLNLPDLDDAGAAAAPTAGDLDDPYRSAVVPSARAMDEWQGAEQAVYQAVGMVVAQLRVSPDEALARLRAHAFAEATTLDQLAMAVVERRVRLTP